MSTPNATAGRELTRLLESIFADDLVTIPERTQLLEFQAGGTLDALEIRRVFEAFVEKRWGQALADGRVTDYEKLALRRVIEELSLPDESLPLQLRLALSHGH
ncbi:MAG: hypothetical protein FJ104_02600 [Deltaproteobacteria bacterium]|nr:hypothetical protein [Deltaproteobacteria bacterium]